MSGFQEWKFPDAKKNCNQATTDLRATTNQHQHHCHHDPVCPPPSTPRHCQPPPFPSNAALKNSASIHLSALRACVCGGEGAARACTHVLPSYCPAFVTLSVSAGWGAGARAGQETRLEQSARYCVWLGPRQRTVAGQLTAQDARSHCACQRCPLGWQCPPTLPRLHLCLLYSHQDVSLRPSHFFSTAPCWTTALGWACRCGLRG